MNPVILFRKGVADSNEEDYARKFFKVIYNRTDVKKDDLVIPRYSALPFYKEFEEDVTKLGGQLINSYSQHQYVADLKNWYEDLKEYTFPTYFRAQDIPDNSGPLVVKGQTNSRKEHWSTRMFAKNKTEAINIMLDLQKDGLFVDQDIYFRKYIPLESLGTGIGGCPISREFRFFYYKDNYLNEGFYWSNHYKEICEIDPAFPSSTTAIDDQFIKDIEDKVSPNINFWVADIAVTAAGTPILVELNDGCMSGLSMCSPEVIYSRLKSYL